MCPGTEAHTYSLAPTCGNLRGFSKEIETFILQMPHTVTKSESSFNKIKPSTFLLLSHFKIHL